MLIYKDLLFGDEMFTDAAKIKLVEGCLWEVECKYVVRKEGDIVLDGANASAEELEEGVDDPATVSGLDVVIDNRLMEAPSFNKKDYSVYLKQYSKDLAEKWKELEWSAEKIDAAKANLLKAAKIVLGNFKNYDKFYTGESQQPEGIVGLLEYRNDDSGNETPYLIFFKDGLEEEKA